MCSMPVHVCARVCVCVQDHCVKCGVFLLVVSSQDWIPLQRSVACRAVAAFSHAVKLTPLLLFLPAPFIARCSGQPKGRIHLSVDTLLTMMSIHVDVVHIH